MGSMMRRAFAIDVEQCARCGARRRLRALVTAPQNMERFLRHIGEPTKPPTLSPARAPPFFKTRVVRRKLGEADDDALQQEMFQRLTEARKQRPRCRSRARSACSGPAAGLRYTRVRFVSAPGSRPGRPGSYRFCSSNSLASGTASFPSFPAGPIVLPTPWRSPWVPWAIWWSRPALSSAVRFRRFHSAAGRRNRAV